MLSERAVARGQRIRDDAEIFAREQETGNRVRDSHFPKSISSMLFFLDWSSIKINSNNPIIERHMQIYAAHPAYFLYLANLRRNERSQRMLSNVTLIDLPGAEFSLLLWNEGGPKTPKEAGGGSEGDSAIPSTSSNAKVRGHQTGVYSHTYTQTPPHEPTLSRSPQSIRYPPALFTIFFSQTSPQKI